MSQEIGLRGYRMQDPDRSRARRREVMLAMAEVISESGYAAATFEDAAARMGTSRAVIYYQFRNKEDLYVAICLEAFAIATRRLEEIIALGQPADATLHQALRALADGRSDPLIRAAIAAGRPPELSVPSLQLLREADRVYEQLLRGVIERGIEDGLFVPRDPKFLVYSLIFAVNGSYLWRRPGGSLPEDYFVEELPAMLMNGVLLHPCDYHAHNEGGPARQLLPSG
jgi:AcrR family transcriptional regulator